MVAEPGSYPQSLVLSRLGHYCSTQTSVALVPHKPTPPLSPLPVSSQFSLIRKVLVLPLPLCLSSACPVVMAVPLCPLPLLQSYPSSPVLPTLWFPVAACLLTFFPSCAPCRGPLLHLSSRKPPVHDSLSSPGSFASSMVVPARKL